MLDVSGDFAIFDKRESVSFLQKTSTTRTSQGKVIDETASVPVTDTLRRQITFRQVNDSGGKLLLGDVFWEVWTINLPDGFVPEKWMIIVPDANTNERWNVLASDLATLKERYRLHCRK